MDRQDRRREPTSGIDAAALWSAPLPSGGGLLTPVPSGGCIASTATSVSAYAPDGRRMWEAPTQGGVFGGEPILTSDGAFVRIEDSSMVVRALDTGELVALSPAMLGSGLCLAPWGDLLYSQAAPGGTAAVHCVTRTGHCRWSVPLDGSAPLRYEPFGLGEVIVLGHRGALWAFDRQGETSWVADLDGVRPVGPEDDAPRPTEGPEAGVHIHAGPVRVDADRVVLELVKHSDRGLYLLDGTAARLTPVAAPSPALPPYAVLPWPRTEYRLVGLGPQVEVAQMRWEYPVVAMEPGGALVWEHRLAARADVLVAAPGGNLIVAASPSVKRWHDYSRWYDLSAQTFVRCLGPDGAVRWTWHPPGPITHFPVVGPDATVLVGCGERLWAFAVSQGSEGE
jgi:hypothetical protein